MVKTFKEVIRDINDGEVWESKGRRIEQVKGGIQISRINGKPIDDYVVCFSDIRCYRLKKKNGVLQNEK
ncbi:hypothetical protein [Clostridium culturomicium]|uniref:hypothetical protein n=1 Tax=Clostridium culturomicium TaxID=1499683 RepID=UPI00385750A5